MVKGRGGRRGQAQAPRSCLGPVNGGGGWRRPPSPCEAARGSPGAPACAVCHVRVSARVVGAWASKVGSGRRWRCAASVSLPSDEVDVPFAVHDLVRLLHRRQHFHGKTKGVRLTGPLHPLPLCSEDGGASRLCDYEAESSSGYGSTSNVLWSLVRWVHPGMERIYYGAPPTPERQTGCCVLCDQRDSCALLGGQPSRSKPR